MYGSRGLQVAAIKVEGELATYVDIALEEEDIMQQDNAYWLSDDADNYGVQMMGMFLPPATGEYAFLVKCSGQVNWLMSVDDDGPDTAQVKFSTHAFLVCVHFF